MQYRKLMPWARKLTVLSVLIALIATVYVSGAATPQEAVASSHVEYVYSDWDLKPSGIVGGDQFRLIFLSSTKRKATIPLNIADYNTSSGPTPPPATTQSGHTQTVSTSSAAPPPCRRNGTTRPPRSPPEYPIYWLKGTR